MSPSSRTSALSTHPPSRPPAPDQTCQSPSPLPVWQREIRSPPRNDRQYATGLDQYKTKLVGSDKPITDTAILNQIIFNLPTDGTNWRMANQFIIRDNINLEQALATLQSYEIDYKTNTAAIATDETATTAYENRGHRGGRGRWRGRGRDQGRMGSG